MRTSLSIDSGVRQVLPLLLIVVSMSMPRVWADQDAAEGVPYQPDREVDPLLLLPINVNGLWGYADRDGTVVIPPTYAWADYFYASVDTTGEGKGPMYARARIVIDGEQYRLIADSPKRRIAASKIRELKAWPKALDRFFGGHQVVAAPVNGRWLYGLLEPAGTWLVEPVHDGLLRISEARVAFERDGVCGFIDDTGRTVIRELAAARSFHGGLAAVRRSEEDGGRWGFMDPQGRLVHEDPTGRVRELRSFHGQRAAVRLGANWGFYDPEFKVVIKPRYKQARDFVGGLAAVKQGRVWGYINPAGDKVAWGFDAAYDFENFGRSGLLDEHRGLCTDLALVKKGTRFGYIDKQGQEVIPPRYTSAHPFFRGVARVASGESFGYIDAAGAWVWDPDRVAEVGIEGLGAPEFAYNDWPGLPGDDDWGEPYPFEYDVEDRLPFSRTRPHETWNPDTSSEPARR